MSAPRFPDRWERSAAAWKLLLKIPGCEAGTFPRGAQRAGKAAAGWGGKGALSAGAGILSSRTRPFGGAAASARKKKIGC